MKLIFMVIKRISLNDMIIFVKYVHLLGFNIIYDLTLKKTTIKLNIT